MAINFDDVSNSDGAGGGDNAELAKSINTTPLIDVLLVLLVMLIITIPIQLNAVNIEIPGSAVPLVVTEPLVVKLDVSATSQLRWDGELVPDRAALEGRLQAASRLAEHPEIHIRAERNTRYESVAAVLTAAQQAGLQKVGLTGLEAAGGL
jgi:biopolymer transport protein ExbD